jgi:class 3 adenylate cyclase
VTVLFADVVRSMDIAASLGAPEVRRLHELDFVRFEGHELHAWTSTNVYVNHA